MSERNFVADKDKEIKPISQAYFHGEDWKKCPVCGHSFEYWTAYYNKKRCPQCGQLFNLK